MPIYKITPYTFKRAKQLGVIVAPSKNKVKKIDVFSRKTKKKLVSVGANGMNDYPTYWKKYGKKIATQRRKLYKQRHEKDRHIKGTAGYYADQLLW
jgi:hypothetical protein